MGRKKEPAKAMFALKHDFVASLDNVCQEAIMLLQAVDMVINFKGGALLPPQIRSMLKERHDAMRAALSEEA